MNRNPIIPFVLIMVFGIGAMFLLSFKGLDDHQALSKEKKDGGEKTEQVATKPEDIYQKTCLGCHGDQYQGGVGPALKGVGDRLSKAEIKKMITKGGVTMPPNLVAEDKADAMVDWLAGLK
ncbi:cytochrome c550 [Cytobacillus sp. Hz8]|uniref:cytochrome c550 n=1 Tax=Cytobacillus sp. Hz8 TaxID=3347168 RepID=UPI0035DC94FA